VWIFVGFGFVDLFQSCFANRGVYTSALIREQSLYYDGMAQRSSKRSSLHKSLECFECSDGLSFPQSTT
jgi:hypothetical protein